MKDVYKRQVNGLMICGPVFEGGGVSTNRPDLVDMKSMPSIGGMVDHPTDKEMSRFFQETMELSQKQFDTFHKYFQKDVYDFAFLGVTTPDRMQHFLWRYTDPGDRTYPGKNKLQNAILEMYQLMEKNVKRLMEEYDKNYNAVSYTHLDVYKRQGLFQTDLRAKDTIYPQRSEPAGDQTGRINYREIWT